MLAFIALGLGRLGASFISQMISVRFSQEAVATLRQGQRKRLALLTAYLKDRPFYLFDEWASDQDPQFKVVFYARLLPDLRANGKAVVVITHDEKYFHVADRVVKLDYGRVNGTNGSHFDLRPLVKT